MAAERKPTGSQAPKPGPRAAPPASAVADREESDTPAKAEPAKKAAPVEKPKILAWVARSHRARGVKEE